MPWSGIKGLTWAKVRKIDPMLYQNDSEQLKDVFLAPAMDAFAQAESIRRCPSVSDQQWVQMGIERALEDSQSGRDFIQNWNLSHLDQAVDFSQFFGIQRSARRLKLVREVNTLVASAMPAHMHSMIDHFPELDGFDIYAGDGHYIGASTHETLVQGKRRPVGHFYTLDLRSHGLTYLTGTDLEDGTKKGEHDMHALKRQSGRALKQGAKKGRKVLYLWDPAGIDFDQWGRWKQSYGVYFLSRAKKNMVFTELEKLEVDPTLAVNAGVLSDQKVLNQSSKTSLRLITYQCPDSGEIYKFVTSELKINPGILAWIYKRRWDLEKTYDTFKNKICETKAWGDSQEAKEMQAQFICLTHNLMVLLEQQTGVTDVNEVQRANKRFEAQQIKAAEQGRTFAPQYCNPLKRSQLGLKFIRWLRHQINNAASYALACRRLRYVYENF